MPPIAFPTDEDRLRVLAERVQRVHAARDHGGVSDHVGVEDARRPVLPAPPARRRRPRGQPRRHRARDPARASSREPRIHFAINCGSNGCPAAAPGGVRRRRPARDAARRHRAASSATSGTAASTTRAPHLHLAPLQDVRARISPAQHGSTQDYRLGVLRFVAATPTCRSTRIADYEVVYNVYDWGLNDAHRAAAPRPDPVPRAGRALSRRRHASCASCISTRATSATAPARWCTINGSPDGWYQPYAPRGARSGASAASRADGNIKFYGGEPTLHAARDHRRHALRCARAASAACSRSSRTA